METKLEQMNRWLDIKGHAWIPTFAVNLMHFPFILSMKQGEMFYNIGRYLSAACNWLLYPTGMDKLHVKTGNTVTARQQLKIREIC